MDKSDKRIIAAVAVGAVCLAIGYFKRGGSKKERIRRMFKKRDYRGILSNYSGEEITGALYGKWGENKEEAFRAILFITMLDVKREAAESRKYNLEAEMKLEEYVEEECGKMVEKYSSRVSDVKTRDFYDLLGCDSESFGSALKLGMDECIKGNLKWAKNIFGSCRSSSNRQLVDLVAVYHGISTCLVTESETHPFLYSKVLDKLGRIEEQKEFLVKIGNGDLTPVERVILMHHKLINLIKLAVGGSESASVELVEYSDSVFSRIKLGEFSSLKNENCFINLICVLMEHSLLNEDDQRISALTGLIDPSIDVRYALITYQAVEYSERRSGIRSPKKMDILTGALKLDKMCYKLHILLGNETKETVHYERALDASTTRSERSNAMRILLVTRIQNEILGLSSSERQ
ncbi:hypothetical protein ECANGB1_880 [Enterospora canceri]|uniref:Uncharacterized protein n=1 Tax=Enterospora canceri TaxID=1081671 RepID=A0A1Y1S7D0_9MICR|nr:hypothetical protein ECANGB1_880 [Enterospora canceri]